MKKTLLIMFVFLCLIFTGCQNGSSGKKIHVAATKGANEDILKVAAKLMEKDGYTVEIYNPDDNEDAFELLKRGRVDAVICCTRNDINNYNGNSEKKFAVVSPLYYKPLCLYKGTAHAIEQLSGGSIISISEKVEGRGMDFLSDLGILKVKSLENPLISEITENPYGVVPTLANIGTITPQNCAMYIMERATADSMKIPADSIVATEEFSGDAVIGSAFVIASKEENTTSLKIEELKKTLTGPAVAVFMENNYNGALLQCR